MPDESFVINAARARELAAEAGFAVSEWLQSPEVLARVGAIAGSDAAAMSSGVPGVDLSLLMPDFEARMASVAENLGPGGSSWRWRLWWRSRAGAASKANPPRTIGQP